MPHIFIESIPSGPSFELSGENSRYMLSVLRMKAGDVFTVFDGKGSRYRAEVESASRNRLSARLMEPLPSNAESGVKTTLLMGLLKGQKMDLVVQKATELGVSGIIPLITERSQIRETRKRQRWQKIAAEASRQCGRAVIPEVKEPVGLRDFIDSKDEMRGFIFWEEGGRPIKEIFPSLTQDIAGGIYIAVGPEGGFTEEEVRISSSKGLVIATLGSRILRAETAAISALAVIDLLAGEI